MKKVFYYLLTAVLLTACASHEDGTLLLFEVSNPSSSRIDVVVDRSTMFEVQLDEHGRAQLPLPGLKNVYAKLVYAPHMTDVYLGEKGKTTVRFDGSDFQNTLEVQGPDREINKYLANLVLPEAPSYELEWSAFSAALEKSAENAVKQLYSQGLDKSSPAFASLETARLQYLYGQQAIMYPLWHAGMTGDVAPLPEDYYDWLKARTVEVESLADVSAYRQFMIFAMASIIEHEHGVRLSSYERTLRSMQYASVEFENPKVRQTLMRCLILEYIGSNGVEGTEDLRKLAKTYITDPVMLSEVESEYDDLDPILPGKPSPDFKAEDVDGTVHTLSEFRGKYLYIDVWATWCAPCRREVPKLKALEAAYEGRNITILGLSVDSDRDAWEKRLASGELSENQLWLGDDSSFMKDYQINGIPRFILLDPEGKIVDADAPRPSSDTIGKLLDGLDNI